MYAESPYSLFLNEIQSDPSLREGEKRDLADLFSPSNNQTQTLKGLKEAAVPLMFNLEPIPENEPVYDLWKQIFGQVKNRVAKSHPEILEEGKYPLPDIKRSDISRLKAAILIAPKGSSLMVTDAFLALSPIKQSGIMAHEAKHLFEHLPLGKKKYTLIKVATDSITSRALSRYNEKQADLEAVEQGFGFDLAGVFDSVKSLPRQPDNLENTKLRQVSFLKGYKAAIRHNLGQFAVIPPLKKKVLLAIMESTIDNQALDPHPDLDKRIDYVLKESYRRAVVQKPHNPLALS